MQVGLTLTIAEKTKVNPSAVWTPTSIFTLKGGVGATATATRISKMNSYSPVATLYDASKDKQNSDRKKCKGKGAGSLLITSDLKITEWLMAQVLVIGTGSSVGVPTSSSSPLKKNVLSQQVKFQLVKSGDISPSWKLTEVEIDKNSTLFSTSRDRTHDLLVTFGPQNDAKSGPSRSAADSFLASQIGIQINQ